MGYLPKNLVAHKLVRYLVISFLLGLITTTISPALIGECHEDEHNDDTSDLLFGTTTNAPVFNVTDSL